ncbi:760_t:CDS:1, partial [Scutellospora calospora]
CSCSCRYHQGCHKHWRSKKRVLCKVCNKPTSSIPKAYKNHA